jgi:hypothetical protein
MAISGPFAVGFDGLLRSPVALRGVSDEFKIGYGISGMTKRW